MTCKLYRHYDETDNLLYVGISLSAVQRLSEHHAQSAWESKIARITVENFPDRESARRAEAVAINDENPLFNQSRPDRPEPHFEEDVDPVQSAQDAVWSLVWAMGFPDRFVTNFRPGRPRIEERGRTLSDRKPWVREKISRATWYRQQKPLTA